MSQYLPRFSDRMESARLSALGKLYRLLLDKNYEVLECNPSKIYEHMYLVRIRRVGERVGGYTIRLFPPQEAK